MFANLSPTALAAISTASTESQRLNHYYLGVEHVFIGILKVDDPAVTESLKQAGLDPVRWRRKVRAALSVGSPPVWGQRLIITPRTHKVVELAEKIRRRGNADQILPVHLLLGLILEGQGLPVRLLRQDGVDLAGLQESLWAGLKRQAATEPQDPRRLRTPALNQYGRDLTAEARRGKLSPLVGRDQELKRLVQILLRKTKRNPMIIGEAGVGKSALVYGLAQYVASPEVLEALQDKRVIELSMTAVVAGTRYRGDFEERLTQIVREARDNPEVILFLDEIHTLMGAGAAMGTMDAANILKPPLANGEIHCIGATTIAEYRRHIEPDAALERRFEVVQLPEPTETQTLEILQGLRPAFESHHQVNISDEALEMAVRLAGRYLTDRHFPDKAIDLVDMAATQVRLETIHRRPGPPSDRPAQPQVGPAAVAQVVAGKIGEAIPEGQLTEADAEKALRLEERLQRRVVGQGEAVAAVARVMRSHLAGLGDQQRPIAVFLFVGPTGVGKTELAKALAAEWFGSQKKLLRFDMSEYGEAHSVSRLLGSPPGYVGHESEGQLSQAIRTHPYAVLLLDEIEKAHPDILKVFLQVFDAGRLTDSKGRNLNFRNAVIIMTSNLGSSQKGQAAIGFGGQKEVEEWESQARKIREAVKTAFPAEFRNRIDAEIVFRPLLDTGVLSQILEMILAEVQAFLAERGVNLSIDPEVMDLLIEKGLSPEFGARELRRTVHRLLRDPLAELLLTGSFRSGDKVRASIDPGGRVSFAKDTV